MVPVENSVSSQMTSNATELKTPPLGFVGSGGYRIQPRQTVANGGLKDDATPEPAQLLPVGQSPPPTGFRHRAPHSGDGGRPLAGQPRFVLVPVAGPRKTLAEVGLADAIGHGGTRDYRRVANADGLVVETTRPP